MKAAVEHRFTGETQVYRPLDATPSYDPLKTNLGGLIQQRTGPAAEDKFVGPMPIGLARPMEASTAIPGMYPFAIAETEDLHRVFMIDGATAAATRRVMLYNYQPSTSQWSWRGFITITFPGSGNQTAKGLRATIDTYSTGTVSVNGTAVTGVDTSWQTERIAAGARIGFGSTNPDEIGVWYEVASFDSETGVTLTSSAGTIPSGPYVIEEVRLVVVTTSSVATGGGVFVIKGLNYGAFTPGGTTVPAATTIDNIRATYWLADAATITNTIGAGCALEDKDSATQQYMYVINGSSTVCRVFKYNIRAPLTGLTSGKTTAAFVYATGNQTVVGAISGSNNGRCGVLNHGPGAGVESLYFVTSTRVYRAPVSDILDGSTTYIAEAMNEIPPGSAATYAPNSVFSSVEIMSSIDRLVITSTGASGARSYVTKYNSNSDPFDHVFLIDNKQYDQSSSSAETPPFPSIGATIFSVWSEGGVTYLCRHGTTAPLSAVYAVPLTAHWTFDNEDNTDPPCVITPKLLTPAANRLERLYINDARLLGGESLGIPPEAVRAFVRTSGIDDNTGEWQDVERPGSLRNITATGELQIKLQFRTLGFHVMPNRVFAVAAVYDTDDYLPPEVEWNLSDSADDGTVGFTQLEAFGETPTFEIRYYRSDTDGLVFIQDSTSTANGVFEYWNGNTWVAGVGPDLIETRRRFRPTAGLPAATTLYAKLSVI